MNAIGIDEHLRTHGKRARAAFVERLGQPALDTGQIAGQRNVPVVVGALRRARPGKLPANTARCFVVA